MYNATNRGKEANTYLILYMPMLSIFENTNFTAVDDFFRLKFQIFTTLTGKCFPIFSRLGNL